MPVYKYKTKAGDRWYVKLRNITKRGFKTRSDALLCEAKLKLTETEKKESLTFGQVSNDFLNHCKDNVEYGTYQKSKHLIREFVIPNMPSDKQISKIKELDCKEFRDKIQKLDYSTRYKNDIIARYKAIFKYAERYYGLDHNPSIVVDRFKKTHEEKKVDRDRQMNIWTMDEFGQFISEVHRQQYKALFILLYFTGMRLGEALALNWNDIQGNTVSITKSLTRKTAAGGYEIKEPKTYSSVRKILINKSVQDYLETYHEAEKAIPGYTDEWFVFGRLSPLPQATIDRVKDSAVKKAGVRRIRIHDLRHSHASNLISDGVNIVAVSKRLGHSDINMTLKVYTHLLEKNNDELIQILEKSSQNLLKKNENAFN